MLTTPSPIASVNIAIGDFGQVHHRKVDPKKFQLYMGALKKYDQTFKEKREKSFEF